MKQTDVITIKKVLSNYFTEDMTETLLEEIIEHCDTDISFDDQPKMIKIPGITDLITASVYLKFSAEDCMKNADSFAAANNPDLAAYAANMADSLTRVIKWVDQLRGLE